MWNQEISLIAVSTFTWRKFVQKLLCLAQHKIFSSSMTCVKKILIFLIGTENSLHSSQGTWLTIYSKKKSHCNQIIIPCKLNVAPFWVFQKSVPESTSSKKERICTVQLSTCDSNILMLNDVMENLFCSFIFQSYLNGNATAALA